MRWRFYCITILSLVVLMFAYFEYLNYAHYVIYEFTRDGWVAVYRSSDQERAELKYWELRENKGIYRLEDRETHQILADPFTLSPEYLKENYTTYQNQLFSIRYLKKYILEEVISIQNDSNSFNTVKIRRDSLDKTVTTIAWRTSNLSSLSSKDFALMKEGIHKTKYIDDFYDTFGTKSLVGGIYESITVFDVKIEGQDTLRQERTYVCVPNQFDMMIVQQLKANEIDTMAEHWNVLQSIKFKDEKGKRMLQ